MNRSRFVVANLLPLLAALAACAPTSDQNRTTYCSNDRELIALIDSEWDRKWQVKRRLTTAQREDCITWSGDPPMMREWLDELKRTHVASGAGSARAVSGTAEEIATLNMALTEAGIAFTTELHGDREWVFWNEGDAANARAVLKRLWGMENSPSAAADKAALAEARKSWTVDDKRASKIVLDAYPDIRANAHLRSAVATFRPHPLPELADAGHYAWIIMAICNDGRMHARFFVHPISGKLVTDVLPGDKDSVRCA